MILEELLSIKKARLFLHLAPQFSKFERALPKTPNVAYWLTFHKPSRPTILLRAGEDE